MARPRRQPVAQPERRIDPETVEQIVNLVQAGVTTEGAIGYAGVPKTTFYRWCMNGRRQPDLYPDEAAMLERLDEAVGRFEATSLLGIRQAGQAGSWQALAWLLERRLPARYSKTIKQDVAITSVSDDPRIVALHQAGFEGDANLLEEEELEQLITLLHKAIPADRRPVLGGDLPVIEQGGTNGQDAGQGTTQAA